MVLFALMIPFLLPLLRMKYVEGVLPLMPRGASTTNNFNTLQATIRYMPSLP